MEKIYNIAALCEDYYYAEYLTIEVLESNNDKIYFKLNERGVWDSVENSCTIQYSKNGSSWTSITATPTTSAEISVNTGDIIKFKGTNNTYEYWSFYFTCSSNVKGNIMSLIYADNFYRNHELPKPADTDLDYHYLLASFFKGCNIKSAEHLILPAKNLSRNYSCYDGMFYGCTSLESAPKLPATTLTHYVYRNMFEGCTSLEIAPELPATRLDWGCYDGMFEDCTSLVTPPELPGTILFYPDGDGADGCYDSMFRGCTSLEVLPKLPATALDNHCYSRMFYGCNKIKMSLTQDSTYRNEYRIPYSGTGTEPSYDHEHYQATYEMFKDTGGTFTGTPTINTTYYTSNEII